MILVDRHNPQYRYHKGRFLGKVRCSPTPYLALLGILLHIMVVLIASTVCRPGHSLHPSHSSHLSKVGVVPLLWCFALKYRTTPLSHC